MKKSSVSRVTRHQLTKDRAGILGLAGGFVGLAWLLAACVEFITPTPVPAQVGAAQPTPTGAIAPQPSVSTTAAATTAAATTAAIFTRSATTAAVATTAASTTPARTTAALTTAATTRAVTTTPAPTETLKTPKATTGAAVTTKAPATTAPNQTTAAASGSQSATTIKKSKFLEALAAATYTPTPKVTYSWTAYEDDTKDYLVIFMGNGQGGDYQCDRDGLQSYEGPKNLPELIDGGYKKLSALAAAPLVTTLNKLPCSTEDRRLSITSSTEAAEVKDRYITDESGDDFTDNLTGLTYTLQNGYYVTGDGVYFIFNNKLWQIEED